MKRIVAWLVLAAVVALPTAFAEGSKDTGGAAAASKAFNPTDLHEMTRCSRLVSLPGSARSP